MSCIITYKGQKYTENDFKQYVKNNKLEFINQILNSPETIAEFKEFISKKDTVESLRAEEQTELQQAFPSVALINGKIEKESLSAAEDITVFEEIYDRYDKLITPLLNAQKQRLESVSKAETTFEQVKKQWLNGGRTEEDWNNMKKEDREYVIKNCL